MNLGRVTTDPGESLALNILIASERFSPSVGGVETVTALLSEALADAGHKVVVITNESGEGQVPSGCQVVRRPAMAALIRYYRAADSVILHGMAVRLGWPLFWRRCRAVVVHHMRTGLKTRGATTWPRAMLSRRVRHAAVSHALACALPVGVETLLPNPYDPRVFQADPNASRPRQVLFVGRLIPEKGAHILVEAIARLRTIADPLMVTLVGTGAEREYLEQLITANQLRQQIRLLGQVTGSSLAQLFREHRIVVIPSLEWESFGLVALEGIASGCAVIGSDLGGLPEAIGPCGSTVRAGDVGSLADKIQEILRSTESTRKFLARADQHLARHRPEAVARRYLEFLNGGGTSTGKILHSNAEREQDERAS